MHKAVKATTMHANRTARTLLAGTALIATALAVRMGGTAHAVPATGYDRCPQGRFCLFDDNNGQGEMYIATGTRYDQVLAEAGFDNRAASVANHSDIVWCVYEGPNYTGFGVGFDPGSRADLETHTLKDQVSSVRYGRYAC